jgi:hypothetical protein
MRVYCVVVRTPLSKSLFFKVAGSDVITATTADCPTRTLTSVEVVTEATGGSGAAFEDDGAGCGGAAEDADGAGESSSVVLCEVVTVCVTVT